MEEEGHSFCQKRFKERVGGGACVYDGFGGLVREIETYFSALCKSC